MRLGLGLGFKAGGGVALTFIDQFSPDAIYGLSTSLAPSSTNAVRVRRTTDSSEQDFTLADINSNTLLNWVVSTDIQALYNNAMYFDGVNDYVITNSGANLNDGTTRTISMDFFFSETPPIAQVLFSQQDGTGTGRTLIAVDTSRRIVSTLGGSSFVVFTSLTVGEVYNIKLTITNGNYSFSLDDVVVNSGTVSQENATGDFIIGSSKVPTFNLFKGVIRNVSITGVLDYTGDGNQNSNWVDQIGSNNGTVNGSPALFTGQGYNATVSDWYDLSGNGHTASQNTALSQAAIVKNGQLTTDNGNAALNFDNDNYDIPVNFEPNFSLFSVDDVIDTASTEARVILSAWDPPSNKSYVFGYTGTPFAPDYNIPYYAVTANGSTNIISDFTYGRDGSRKIINFNSFGGSVDLYDNNNLVDSDTATIFSSTAQTKIGSVQDGTAGYEGKISFIAIFNSEQSANDINTAINEIYGVY